MSGALSPPLTVLSSLSSSPRSAPHRLGPVNLTPSQCPSPPPRACRSGPSGKFSIVTNPQSPSHTLVSLQTWNDFLEGVQHVCVGIDEFAKSMDAKEKKANVTTVEEAH